MHPIGTGIDHPELAAMMELFRLASLVLAIATIIWWGSSFWRVLRGVERAGDGQRAIGVTLAIACLLFQVRWLAPGLEELTRSRLWVLAQAAMVATQLAVIYHQGRDDPRFDTRRTLLAHAAMLAGCAATVAMIR